MNGQKNFINIPMSRIRGWKSPSGLFVAGIVARASEAAEATTVSYCTRIYDTMYHPECQWQGDYSRKSGCRSQKLGKPFYSKIPKTQKPGNMYALEALSRKALNLHKIFIIKIFQVACLKNGIHNHDDWHTTKALNSFLADNPWNNGEQTWLSGMNLKGHGSKVTGAVV